MPKQLASISISDPSSISPSSLSLSLSNTIRKASFSENVARRDIFRFCLVKCDLKWLKTGNSPMVTYTFSCIRLIEGPLSFSFLATEQRLVHRLIAWEFKSKGLAKRALAGALGSYKAGALGSIGLSGLSM